MTKRKPVFDNILKVLRREAPPRPVLIDLFLNEEVYNKFCDPKYLNHKDSVEYNLKMATAYASLGYDYFTAGPTGFGFPTVGGRKSLHTASLNHDATIWDRKSFDAYKWPEPEDFSFEVIDSVFPLLPEGMRAIMIGPGGVLENIISLMGFDNLCIAVHDNPELVSDVAENVGKRFARYYALAAEHEIIGAAFGNDDWGFNTQTMLSPKHMEKYIFPWHKEIVAAMHKKGKPCILHSCGNPVEVMDSITDHIKYDGRHSYEDVIIPVEDFYDRYHDRIAVIGGIDVHFISTKTPEEVKERSRKMLERTSKHGGYALGTGNSVPYYIPMDNYLAMLAAAYEFD